MRSGIIWNQVLLLCKYVQIAQSPSTLSKWSRNGARISVTQAQLPEKCPKNFFFLPKSESFSLFQLPSFPTLFWMGRLGTEQEAKIFKVWWGARAKVNPYKWTHTCVNVVCSLGRNCSLKEDVKNYRPYQSQEEAQEPVRQESENWSRSQEIWSLVPPATRLLNKSITPDPCLPFS